MRIVLLSLIAVLLTACSNSYDKYVGYWKLEDSRSQTILKITKEGKDTYLVNQNIFTTTDLLGKPKQDKVLEKYDNKSLGFNNDLTVVPYNLSEDGKVLRTQDKKYFKISEKEALTALDNNKRCEELFVNYKQEVKPFLYVPAERDKRIQIGEKYIELQKSIPECSLHISLN